MPIHEIPAEDENSVYFTLDSMEPMEIDSGLLNKLLGLYSATDKASAPCYEDAFRAGWNAAVNHIIQCPKKVIFNGPATVVLWEDGSKTVVHCQPGDAFIPETGLMAAILKRIFGNTGSYNTLLKATLAEAEFQSPYALSAANEDAALPSADVAALPALAAVSPSEDVVSDDEATVLGAGV